MREDTEARGRERIFDDWIAAHGGTVIRTARAFARGADRDDLEQELLLAVWRAIPAFRGGSSVSTFLYRVTHNAALTWRRSARARSERDQRVAAELARDLGDALPFEDGDESRTLERLYEEIHALPPIDRSLVLLSLDGVSYSEMAEIHGLTPNHVGVRLTRARQDLAAKFQGETR
jgi:RNA polymerase sigma-70 factor (ECF subfamily)